MATDGNHLGIPKAPFSVSEGHWGLEANQFCVEQERAEELLIKGETPDGTLTRFEELLRCRSGCVGDCN